MRKEEKSQIQGPLNTAVKICFGTFAAFAFTILLLLLAAFGVSMGVLRDGHIPQITTIASVLGVFTGAFLTNSEKKVWHGVLVGICFVLLLMVVKILFYGNNKITSGAIILILATLCAGSLSGFASRGKRKGRERRKKHIRK